MTKEKMKAKIRLLINFTLHGSSVIALAISITNFNTIAIRSTRRPAMQKAKQTGMIIGFIIFAFFLISCKSRATMRGK